MSEATNQISSAEARRRKILEKGKDRLAKITGESPAPLSVAEPERSTKQAEIENEGCIQGKSNLIENEDVMQKNVETVVSSTSLSNLEEEPLVRNAGLDSKLVEVPSKPISKIEQIGQQTLGLRLLLAAFWAYGIHHGLLQPYLPTKNGLQNLVLIQVILVVTGVITYTLSSSSKGARSNTSEKGLIANVPLLKYPRFVMGTLKATIGVISQGASMYIFCLILLHRLY